jgi:multisubunit Na+/H+ antiporter MnhC subunit
MMGWSKAFWKGFVIFLWTALWAIVGVLIFSLLSASIFASMVSIIQNPQDVINNPQLINDIVQKYIGPIMLIIILVAIFVGIATYATIVRVITNTVMEEIKRTPSIQMLNIPPPPPASSVQQFESNQSKEETKV